MTVLYKYKNHEVKKIFHIILCHIIQDCKYDAFLIMFKFEFQQWRAVTSEAGQAIGMPTLVMQYFTNRTKNCLRF